MNIQRRLGVIVVLTSTAMGGALLSFAGDLPPGAKAREDVEFLVEGVEATHDCEITLDTLVTRIDAVNGHFTVVVRLDGNECEAAFRALQLRSEAFPFSFLAIPEPDGENTEIDSGDDT